MCIGNSTKEFFLGTYSYSYDSLHNNIFFSGKDKAEILKQVIQGPVTPEVPGSILQFHPDCTIIADEDALSAMDF